MHSIHDGGRHQFGRVVAGVSEHQPLITSADHAVVTVYALIYIGRLAVEPDLDFAALRVDTGRTVSIAGVAQHVGHDRHGPRARRSERVRTACLNATAG